MSDKLDVNLKAIDFACYFQIAKHGRILQGIADNLE